jgi:hypothetical protein
VSRGCPSPSDDGPSTELPTQHTPIAEPFDDTIGDPDIPGMIPGTASEMPSAPPKRRTTQDIICLFAEHLCVWRAQHRDVGNGIDEEALSPHARRYPDMAEQVLVGCALR